MRSRLYCPWELAHEFSHDFYDPDLLRADYQALDAAWDQQQRSWDDIAATMPGTRFYGFPIIMAAVQCRGTRSRAPEARSLEHYRPARTLNCRAGFLSDEFEAGCEAVGAAMFRPALTLRRAKETRTATAG